MSDAANRFYRSIENAANETQSSLVELFVYFLTVEAGHEFVTPAQVADCLDACDLGVPRKNVGARLSEGLKGRPPRYLKSKEGYRLQRHMREALSKKLGAEKIIAQTSATLRRLEHRLPAGADKEFLRETIDCFEAGAGRATIVMAWILATDHLFSYIMAHKLEDFNIALAANTDKSVKVKVIGKRDDFTEMKESKFIEICRQSRIISNDVRKVLEQKLDIRNSCAHPSGVVVNTTKVIDFVEDLIENVVLKYVV